MRAGLAVGLFGIALLGACAQQPPKSGMSGDMVVILPKPDGHVGAVVVRPKDGGEPVLLNKAYAAATLKDPKKIQTATVEPQRVKEAFGPTLAALPTPPASFLIYFVEGTDELSPDSTLQIKRVLAEVAARPSPELAVIGHTDFIGSEQYNDTLSLQRARKIRDQLVQRGIPAKNIQVAGRGKREPLYPTSDDVAEPRNRRVEIIVR